MVHLPIGDDSFISKYATCTRAWEEIGAPRPGRIICHIMADHAQETGEHCFGWVYRYFKKHADWRQHLILYSVKKLLKLLFKYLCISIIISILRSIASIEAMGVPRMYISFVITPG